MAGKPPIFVTLGIELASTSDTHDVAAFCHASLQALPGFTPQSWRYLKKTPPTRGPGTPTLATLEDPAAMDGWIVSGTNGSIGLTSNTYLRKTDRAWRNMFPDKHDGWDIVYVMKDLDTLDAKTRTALLRALRDLARRAPTQLDVVSFNADFGPGMSPTISTLKGVEALFRRWL